MSEIASIVASGSYDPTHLTVKESIDKLISLSETLAGDTRIFETPPIWVSNIGKFKAINSRVSSNLKVFAGFAKKSSEHILVPLFPDATSSTPNDSFLKNQSSEINFRIEANPENARAVSAMASINGPIVYWDTTDSTLVGICMPIGEIYRAAIARHVLDASTVSGIPMPFLVMYYLYVAMYHSSSEIEDDALKASLKSNVKELASVLEDMSPNSGPGKTAVQPAFGNEGAELSDRLSGIFNIISKFAAAASPGTDEKDISGALRGITDTVSNIVSQVTNKSANDDPNAPMDPTKIVATIGEVFQSKDTQAKFTNAAKNASDVFGPLLGMGKQASGTG